MPADKAMFMNKVQDIINEANDLYEKKRSIQERNHIPNTQEIPLENKLHWLRIPNVICVYVDMIGSTLLSVENESEMCAKIFHYFSDTIARLFHEFEAPYIDIQGDGVFALFNYDQPYRALASAVTVKSFIENYFNVRVNTMEKYGAKMGIDQNTVLVRKIGLKFHNRSDRQNELWAGKTVNMAAKLSSITNSGELLVSDRYFSNLKNDLVLKSCGCENGVSGGNKKNLWTEKDVSSYERFDFNKAYLLKSAWCPNHGQSYCKQILELDQ